jgi:hypothetical protein
LLADYVTDALEFLRHMLVGSNDFIERVGLLCRQTNPSAWKPDRKVTIPHGLQAGQNNVEIQRSVGGLDFPLLFARLGGRFSVLGATSLSADLFMASPEQGAIPSTIFY